MTEETVQQQVLFEGFTEVVEPEAIAPAPKDKPLYWVKIVWLDDLQTAYGYLGSHDKDGSYDISSSPKRKPRLYKNIKVAQRTAHALSNKRKRVTVEEWKGRIE